MIPLLGHISAVAVRLWKDVEFYRIVTIPSQDCRMPRWGLTSTCPAGIRVSRGNLVLGCEG